jgi:hypothetical protein
MPRAVYICVRALHLVVTAATLPLGLQAYVTGDVSVSRLLVFVVASVLALFVVTMDQADYPTTAAGALRRTGPLLLNAAAGAWRGGMLGAAHWTLSSLVASLAASLAIAAVLALRSDDEVIVRNRGIVVKLVIPLAIGAAIVAVLVAVPLARGATPSLPTIVAAATWLLQTAFTTRAWMLQSTFATPRADADAREIAARPWRSASAVAVVMVMAAFAWVLLSS